MLKNLISVLSLVFFCGGFAFAAVPTARVFSYNENKDKFFAPKLAANRPITYCVYISDEAKDITDAKDFDEHIKLAYKLWMAYPAKMIRQAGRAEEFAKVLQSLEKEPDLISLQDCNFLPYPQKYKQFLAPQPAEGAEPADISFFYENHFFAHLLGREKIPPHYTYNPVPRVVLPTRMYRNYSNLKTMGNDAAAAKEFSRLKQQILATPNADFEKMSKLIDELQTLVKKFAYDDKSLFYGLMHEVGHSIGLADQKANSQDNSDMLYSTVNPRQSIMDNITTVQTCDDADGIIMLFDDALGIKRDFESLCNDGIKFSNGKESFKGQKSNYYRTRDVEMERIYDQTTKDTGVYTIKREEYTGTYSKEDSQNIYDKFDRSAMPKDVGGYQYYEGQMRLTDLNKPEGSQVPVGKHKSKLTLGPGAQHKQILYEEFDNNGKLLNYKLEIYEYDKLQKTKTKAIK